jgi:hypothetical protein
MSLFTWNSVLCVLKNSGDRKVKAGGKNITYCNGVQTANWYSKCQSYFSLSVHQIKQQICNVAIFLI